VPSPWPRMSEPCACVQRVGARGSSSRQSAMTRQAQQPRVHACACTALTRLLPAR
jgi:hypothetical protein